MVHINHLLGQVKDELQDLLAAETIFEHCRAVGHRWRRSPLNPAMVIHLFIVQLLEGNTACSHLRLLSDRSFTASAYCQARQRLPLKVITRLARYVAQAMESLCDASARWHGHRVWRVDGTGVSMPDTPALRSCFGQPTVQPEGCGFPVASLVARIHAGTGMILDMVIGPLVRHDMRLAPKLHERLKPGDLMLADRGFCSYAHLALLAQHGLNAVFRQHQRRHVKFKHERRREGALSTRRRNGQRNTELVRELGENDQIVRYFKSTTPKPKWMSRDEYDALPEQIEVREVRYRIKRSGFRTRTVILVTTLTDEQTYPEKEIAELYGDRWQVEVELRDLKTSLGMDVLHCKTVEGVLKEIWMFALVYNLVRLVMLQAAARQRTPPDRISFTDALRHLRQFGLTDLNRDLIVNPARPGRVEPRVIKRRMKKFPLMVHPRGKLRQALMKAEVTD